MRWEIEKRVKSTEVQNEEKYITTTTTIERNKIQYITVGDIVAMGKSAAGAVGNLANKLPGFISGLKADGAFPESIAVATALNGVVQPLSIMVKGLEVYKTVMSVIDTLTPIMKTVARASGVWCSPGNIADLAQIAVGTVQQILIGIAISAIIKLKNWVWSFEFPIRRVSIDDQKIINKKMKHLADYISSNGGGNPASMIDPSTGKEYTADQSTVTIFNKKIDEAANSLRSMFTDEKGNSTATVNADINTVVNILFGDGPSDDELIKGGRNCKNNYMTEYHPNGDPTFVRMLGGSDHDTGIYYSDDKGKTWIRSNVTKGSFKKFAKLPVGKDKYIYVAGGAEYVKNVKGLEKFKGFEKNEVNHYNKDYFSLSKNGIIERLPKTKKDIYEKEYSSDLSLIPLSNLAYDKGDYVNSPGIYYSEDDGLNWKVSNIDSGAFENMFEYKEKVDHKPTIVAASYDYEGIYYTEDGKEWIRSRLGKEDGFVIKTERWVELSDSLGTDPRVYTSDISVNTSILSAHQPEFGTKNIKPKAVVVCSASTNTSIDIKCISHALIGEGLESASTGEPNEETRNIQKVIRRMHKFIEDQPNKDELLAAKANEKEFWLNHIELIKKGEYTYKDAERGKDIL